MKRVKHRALSAMASRRRTQAPQRTACHAAALIPLAVATITLLVIVGLLLD